MVRNLKSLMGRLDGTTRRALEAAAGQAMSQSHYEVELEHWIQALLETPETDLEGILAHYQVSRRVLETDLRRAIGRFKTGNSRNPVFSPTLVDLVVAAWSVASIDFGATAVRSSHLLVALLSDLNLLRRSADALSSLKSIPLDGLRNQLAELTQDSVEARELQPTLAPSQTKTGEETAPGGALASYTIDLTADARAGRIDPIIGREEEIRQVIDILMRRRQNNPILTGEAGVGKTAVVEGLALRIAAGDVPPPLKNVALRTLDLALLQAGAGVKGEFESRLKGLIEEVKASPRPIILFIDEAHNLVGAGGTAGQGDAANLLKPALARGELRTIAATTWSEYKQYFEGDAALARRFQVVQVPEPTEQVAVLMLRRVAERLAIHHGVTILPEAVEAAVNLSHRYITGRQLPDKAVSVLDTAAARVAISQVATPARLEDLRLQREHLLVEQKLLLEEQAVGGEHAERLRELEEAIPQTEQALVELEKRWTDENGLVGQLRDIRKRIVSSHGSTPDSQPSTDSPEALRAQLGETRASLSSLQGETPLVYPFVDTAAVAAIIGSWTGIPVGRMRQNDLETAQQLESLLGARVIGQRHAIDTLAERIRIHKAGLEDPDKPVGVFLLVGPSGVGKTETALALADLLYGGDQNLITVNMSEYQEAHTVSSLKGAPPGYVGYGRGGVLTEAVRRRPYSVLLLDELEKAHPDVLELFYQVFDKGWMEDGEGRRIDFKNTLILMTSNLGTDLVMDACRGGDAPEVDELEAALRPLLNRHLQPAFVGRLTVLPYFPLRDAELRGIARLKLGRIAERVRRRQRLVLTWDESVLDEIVRRCTEVDTGGRNIDLILNRTLLPELSRQLLAAMASGGQAATAEISFAPAGLQVALTLADSAAQS